MRLTFHREYTSGRIGPAVMPYTETGEPLDDVLSCSVESAADDVTVMVIKVHVRSDIDNAETRGEREKKHATKGNLQPTKKPVDESKSFRDYPFPKYPTNKT